MRRIEENGDTEEEIRGINLRTDFTRGGSRIWTKTRGYETFAFLLVSSCMVLLIFFTLEFFGGKEHSKEQYGRNNSARNHLQSSSYAEIKVNDSAMVCIFWPRIYFFVRTNYTPYPPIPALDGIMQTVSGTRDKFFTFSAYYDPRKANRLPVVRVIGTTKTFNPDPVSCLLWYPNHQYFVRVGAALEVLNGHRNLSYSAYFILCPIAHGMAVPHSVSIVAGSSTVSNRHVVNDQLEKACINNTLTLGVCVKPIYFNYDKALQLIEFVEMYRLLGARQFYFYTTSVTNRTDCILQYYKYKGGFTVLPIPHVLSDDEIRVENAYTIWNDCPHRSMINNVTHLAMVDLDELIIPNRHDTLPDLIRHLDGGNHGSRPYGDYHFRNAFHYLEWDDDKASSQSSDPFERSLTILRKTRRVGLPSPRDIEVGKSIIRPVAAVEVGNHNLFRMADGYDRINVEERWGSSHHYRRLPSIFPPDNLTEESLTDSSALRYRDRITTAIKVVWMEIQEKCGLQDVVTESEKIYEPGLPGTYNEIHQTTVPKTATLSLGQLKSERFQQETGSTKTTI